MPLVVTPKEVLEMGIIERDPDTGKEIFPKNATPKQIKAYYEWCKMIKKASEETIVIEE